MTRPTPTRFALVLLLVAAPMAGAQDQPTLDELLDLAPPEAPEAADVSEAPESPEPLPSPAAPEPDPELQRALEQGAPDDVFDAAVQQMDGVARRLGERRDAGLATQREQESILRKLDQVIAAAQQQQQQSSSSSGGQGGQQQQARSQDVGGQQVAGQQGQQPGQGQQPQPGQAQANQTGEHSGEASPGSVTDGTADRPLEEIRREWGNLPPRLRDELTEGLAEPFSPVYRDMTEAYYRALAEAQEQE